MPAERVTPAGTVLTRKDYEDAVLDVRTIQTTEAHPTMELRFVKRPAVLADQPEKLFKRVILQQRWGVITFNHLSQPIKRESEWRDVPLVEEWGE